MSRKIAIAYIPVLHQGYVAFLQSLKDESVEALYLIEDELLASHEELDYIHRKDRLRAVPHELMLTTLRSIAEFPIESLTIASVMELKAERASITAPREDINTLIMETYFGGHSVTYKEVFLRWNRENLGEAQEPKVGTVVLTDFEKEVLQKIHGKAEKSADWWRQVGAALIKDGSVIAMAHNAHLPEEEHPNVFGDARSLFNKGVNVNYVTSGHAEVSVIGMAAQKGISTEGATLITTDFPCPFCARAIARSGIKNIYYEKGYAVLGGDTFFKDMGIEVFKIAE